MSSTQNPAVCPNERRILETFPNLGQRSSFFFRCLLTLWLSACDISSNFIRYSFDRDLIYFRASSIEKRCMLRCSHPQRTQVWLECKLPNIMHRSPTHLFLSGERWYPNLQVHLKLPGVFKQSWWQPPFANSEHSSMSNGKKQLPHWSVWLRYQIVSRSIRNLCTYLNFYLWSGILPTLLRSSSKRMPLWKYYLIHLSFRKSEKWVSSTYTALRTFKSPQSGTKESIYRWVFASPK